MSTLRPLVVSAVAASALVAGGVMAQPAGGRGGQPGGGGGFSADRFVDRMMQSDANADGKLTRDELPARFADQMFEDADANSDDELDRDELTKYAEERFANRAGARPGAGAGAGGAFEMQMKRAGDAARSLRDSEMNEQTRASDLAQLGVIQAALVTAKNQSASVAMSTQAKEKYADDEDAYRRDMRLGIIGAIEKALAAERALLQGDAEGARTRVKEMLDERNAAHKVFREDI